MRRIVDLPQPDGPSRARNEPCSVCRFASLSATTLLRPEREDLVQSRDLQAGAQGVALGTGIHSTRVRVGCDIVVSDQPA